MRWKRDWGLTLRMAGVMVLMALLYLGFGVALTWYFHAAAAVAIALVAISAGQLLWGHKVALKSIGGEPVSEAAYPELHARVDRLSQQANIKKPDVAVAETSVPNAFAAGRSEDTAVVCVTTGLLALLRDDELDGVLAHELAHIRHRDVVIMTIASAISMVAYWIVRWGWIFDDGGASGGENSAPHFLVAFAASLVIWIASFFILRILSRYREYAADRGAASITGNPTALASALRKIDSGLAETPDEDLREKAGMSALLFMDIDEGRLTKWFRTHPGIDERINRLRDLERQL